MAVGHGGGIGRQPIPVLVLSSTRSGIRTAAVALRIVRGRLRGRRRLANDDVRAGTAVVVAFLAVACLGFWGCAVSGCRRGLLGGIVRLFGLLISVSFAAASFAVVVDGELVHFVGCRIDVVGSLQEVRKVDSSYSELRWLNF